MPGDSGALRALIPNPEIVFLDELTTGLNARARRDVWSILEELKKKGMTMLLTSHFMDEVEALCSIASILSLRIIAKVYWGFRMKGSWGIFFAGWLIVLVSILSIGMLVGGLAKNNKTASVIASVLYFSMLVFSGATLPYKVMPAAMQYTADIMPLTQGIKIRKAAVLGETVTNMPGPVIIMLIIAAVCIGCSVKFFRWE